MTVDWANIGGAPQSSVPLPAPPLQSLFSSALRTSCHRKWTALIHNVSQKEKKGYWAWEEQQQAWRRQRWLRRDLKRPNDFTTHYYCTSGICLVSASFSSLYPSTSSLRSPFEFPTDSTNRINESRNRFGRAFLTECGLCGFVSRQRLHAKLGQEREIHARTGSTS